jgi:hypothetical protein
MKTQLVLILIVICSACQSGRIPCPDARGPKIKKIRVNSKRAPEYSASLNTRRGQPETRSQSGQVKDSEGRFVKNVSVEEWDCPRPGEKKYMPRSIKGNIKRNMKKMNEEPKQKEEESEAPGSN